MDIKKNRNIKIVYIHNMTCPNPEANVLQAITMASAFSNVADTVFMIPRLRTSKSELKQQYGISNSNLKIQSIYLDHLPIRFNRFFNKFVSLIIRFHPKWSRFQGVKILFVRSPKELLFWGSIREHNKWLRDWKFIFEAHDALGLDPSQFKETNTIMFNEEIGNQKIKSLLKSLSNFDVVVCVTQELADDIMCWSDNAIKPHVIRHASFLPRIDKQPQIKTFGEKIVLGYIGTIDRYRGVDVLIKALRYLPKNYNLRLVGRTRTEKNVDPNWIEEYLKDPQISARLEFVCAVPINKVATEIDRCDILIQPASNDIIDSRYASPLKSFDYMARGKPIVIADVPCHHEIFKDGENAIYYNINDPQNLAACIINLVNNPNQAQKIAISGWKQVIEYSYERRVKKILDLVDNKNGTMYEKDK